jgi:hypothetical protein
MTQRPRHDHIIVQQIIPAPADCYAVFAWQLGGEAPTVVYERVPCFALISDCRERYKAEDEVRRPCRPEAWQRVQPCIRFEGEDYVPVSDPMVQADDWEIPRAALRRRGQQGGTGRLAASRDRGIQPRTGLRR